MKEPLSGHPVCGFVPCRQEATERLIYCNPRQIGQGFIDVCADCLAEYRKASLLTP